MVATFIAECIQLGAIGSLVHQVAKKRTAAGISLRTMQLGVAYKVVYILILLLPFEPYYLEMYDYTEHGMRIIFITIHGLGCLGLGFVWYSIQKVEEIEDTYSNISDDFIGFYKQVVAASALLSAITALFSLSSYEEVKPFWLMVPSLFSIYMGKIFMVPQCMQYRRTPRQAQRGFKEGGKFLFLIGLGWLGHFLLIFTEWTDPIMEIYPSSYEGFTWMFNSLVGTCTVFIVIGRWRRSHINSDGSILVFAATNNDGTDGNIESTDNNGGAQQAEGNGTSRFRFSRWSETVIYIVLTSVLTLVAAAMANDFYMYGLMMPLISLSFIPWSVIVVLLFYGQHFWSNPAITKNARRVALHSDGNDDDEMMGITEGSSTIPDYLLSGNKGVRLGLLGVLVLSLLILMYAISLDDEMGDLLVPIIFPMLVVVAVLFCGCKLKADTDTAERISRSGGVREETEMLGITSDHPLLLTEESAVATERQNPLSHKTARGGNYKAPMLDLGTMEEKTAATATDTTDSDLL